MNTSKTESIAISTIKNRNKPIRQPQENLRKRDKRTSMGWKNRTIQKRQQQNNRHSRNNTSTSKKVKI